MAWPFSSDVSDAARAMQPMIGPETFVVPLQNGVEEVAKRFLSTITQEDYDNFIAPYDARKTLDGIRKKVRVRKG